MENTEPYNAQQANSVLSKNTISLVKSLAALNVVDDMDCDRFAKSDDHNDKEISSVKQDNVVVNINEERNGPMASELSSSIIQTEDSKDNALPLKTLYPNEQLYSTKFEDFIWARYLGHNVYQGSFYMTDFRILYMNDAKNETLISIPYGIIARVEKIGTQSTASDGSYGIEIYCKDFRRVFFAVRKAGKVRRNVYDEICSRSFWRKQQPHSNLLWPQYSQKYKEDTAVDVPGFSLFVKGWNVYRPVAEYDRMNLPHKSGEPWYVDCFINHRYTFCETYPSVIVYPSQFKPDLNESGFIDPDCSLMQVRDHRSKGRIPILSWYSKKSHATICRCSQPMSGLAHKPNEADHKMFNAIADCNPMQPNGLLIFDARPKMNARANMTLGGGYETYPEHDFEFLGIPNIHVMRESLKKLEDLLYPTVKDNKSYFMDLDNCGWLWYIKQILHGACRIATSVSTQSTSVVVHCSDGWDRTAQLTSLSMLMLDGYYRTLEGFMVLIEKEWISCGHKLATRIGHGDDKYGDNERSPIFLQFIDAVYQFHLQATAAFEFNEHFLITLLDHLYICQFGNFLSNCEREKMDQKVCDNTLSLWSYIFANQEEFTNPFFDPTTMDDVLIPTSSIRALKLWTNYYCRYCVGFQSTMHHQVKKWKQLQLYKKKLQSDIDEMHHKLKQHCKSTVKATYNKCKETDEDKSSGVEEESRTHGNTDDHKTAELDLEKELITDAIHKLSNRIRNAQLTPLSRMAESLNDPERFMATKEQLNSLHPSRGHTEKRNKTGKEIGRNIDMQHCVRKLVLATHQEADEESSPVDDRPSQSTVSVRQGGHTGDDDKFRLHKLDIHHTIEPRKISGSHSSDSLTSQAGEYVIHTDESLEVEEL